MKKILIVNNNMKVGGVQKSLYNLLWETDGEFDVTLCLFKKTGEYADKLPSSVKVVEARGAFRYLGISQGECKGADIIKRGFLAALCRVFGRKKTLSWMRYFQPTLDEKYDCAISFLHNGRPKAFYGGTQDFVLDCVNADKKVAFLHGDYRNCGADNPENNSDMTRFDLIAACSDGCRRAFESVLTHLKDKCITVRNFHRFDEICSMADEEPVTYDQNYVNIVMVARLSHEKGIDRALYALKSAIDLGIAARLHIVGGGGERSSLVTLAEGLNISDSVFFYGEQANPYRYMKNADMLLLCSYHEAAPMVIDEARCLGVPILTTETTSSYDMVTDMECGWVCENTQSALTDTFIRVISDKDGLESVKGRLKSKSADNSVALEQFRSLL
ncbi:MAG: glycosyltransferase [Clostridia bacterium]|nr:glycosyltransferase [Clostridia bacterium]